MGGLANADVIRGGRSMLTGGGGKICQNLADVIYEHSLKAASNRLLQIWQVFHILRGGCFPASYDHENDFCTKKLIRLKFLHSHMLWGCTWTRTP